MFSWQADILQVRMIEKGETVGYGAEYTATQTTKLATIGVGYADGYARASIVQTKIVWQLWALAVTPHTGWAGVYGPDCC